MLAAAQPGTAQSPRDKMFPGPDACYARAYAPAHLAAHPAQRVTGISVNPSPGFADPFLGLYITLRLRGVPGGAYEANAACENEAGHLYCTMEGDAGGFRIDQAKDGAIRLSVSSRGMSFENDTGFTTLEQDSGDDRVFLLHPAACH
ncbi:MAG: hypothetical protein ACK4GM_08790 [Tabrizicola sp.]